MQMPFYRRTHTFTHKRFYTQTLLHIDTDAFPHRPFYTQTLLHTNTFTHIRFYTRTLLHANTFTYRRFYTQTLLHSDTFTQTLFHTDPFTHRRFYTQTLLHRRFHRDFYTETLTKRGTTGWPQLQTKVRKHSCNGNAKKSQKCTRPGSVPWSTHNPMQGIRSLRYKISSAPWCRGWPQLQTQVGKKKTNTSHAIVSTTTHLHHIVTILITTRTVPFTSSCKCVDIPQTARHFQHVRVDGEPHQTTPLKSSFFRYTQKNTGQQCHNLMPQQMPHANGGEVTW